MFGVSLLASLHVYADVGKSAVGVLMGISGSVSGWIESVDHVGFVMMLRSPLKNYGQQRFSIYVRLL